MSYTIFRTNNKFCTGPFALWFDYNIALVKSVTKNKNKRKIMPHVGTCSIDAASVFHDVVAMHERS